jgi:hypothetical protein
MIDNLADYTVSTTCDSPILRIFTGRYLLRSRYPALQDIIDTRLCETVCIMAATEKWETPDVSRYDARSRDGLDHLKLELQDAKTL